MTNRAFWVNFDDQVHVRQPLCPLCGGHSWVNFDDQTGGVTFVDQWVNYRDQSHIGPRFAVRAKALRRPSVGCASSIPSQACRAVIESFTPCASRYDGTVVRVELTDGTRRVVEDRVDPNPDGDAMLRHFRCVTPGLVASPATAIVLLWGDMRSGRRLRARRCQQYDEHRDAQFTAGTVVLDRGSSDPSALRDRGGRHSGLRRVRVRLEPRSRRVPERSLGHQRSLVNDHSRHVSGVDVVVAPRRLGVLAQLTHDGRPVRLMSARAPRADRVGKAESRPTWVTTSSTHDVHSTKRGTARSASWLSPCVSLAGRVARRALQGGTGPIRRR